MSFFKTNLLKQQAYEQAAPFTDVMVESLDNDDYYMPSSSNLSPG